MAASNNEPVYRLLADDLRSQIRAGAFPPSRRLPTEAELSREFGVSRQTVRRAFSDLVAEGLVYRVPGRGTFALCAPYGEQYLRSFGSIDDLLALSVDTELEMLEPFTRSVNVAAAGRLGLATDEVFTGVFRRLHGGVPFAVTTVYLPPELGGVISRDPRVTQVGARSSTTIIQLIGEVSESPLLGAHQSITATICDAETAALIGGSAGEPALAIDRVYFDANGQFVELAASMFNVRRYSYRLELRRRVR